MFSAIVLGGGCKGGLTDGQGDRVVSEPFIRVGRRYMIEYVVEALRDSEYIREIIIAGPVEALEKIYKGVPEISLTNGGDTAIRSFLNAFGLVRGDPDKILIVTGDIPLLTKQAVNDFIESCLRQEGDLFYPIVKKETNESRYPGTQRTYVTLKEGAFTGGNVLMVNARVIQKCIPVAERLVYLRKKPLRLASFLGWDLLMRYLLGILSVRDAEKRVSDLLGVRGYGIISPYPEIGIDVDKKSDLLLVTKELSM